VRRLGIELGCARDSLSPPFPDPPGVRSSARCARIRRLLRAADAIYIEELRKHDLYDRISQAFASSCGALGGRHGRRRRYDT